MHFNWLYSDKKNNDKLQKACIELEYQLRPRITKFLLQKLDSEEDVDLSSIGFDVDLDAQYIGFASGTPQAIVQQIQQDFDTEINAGFSNHTFFTQGPI